MKPGSDPSGEARAAQWCEGWSTGMVEGMTSAAALLLEAGDEQAARAVHAVILRRFETRCFSASFLELDVKLNPAPVSRVSDADGL